MPDVIAAAGIMLLCKSEQGKRVLFVQRSGEGDHAGEWCFPGGKIEFGEDAMTAAEREVREECGPIPYGKVTMLTRSVTPELIEPYQPSVDFTTFIAECKDQVIPTLDHEHTAFAWAPPDNPPQPLHPGCQIALDRLTMDELGMAEAIRDGRLTSPQKFHNMWLFAIRITGTGMAYRNGRKEHVWRDPTIYLNERFLQRCNGLAVIWKHPAKNLLNSKEFKDRNVGAIMLAYIKEDEVWGIAKIYDEDAVSVLLDNRDATGQDFSTSPAVFFPELSVNKTLTLDDGSKLLIEGDPGLLDHIALVEQGVWDKGGEPAGVDTVTFGDSQVADTDDKAKADAEEKAKADAARADAARADEKLDKVLSFVDAMSTRMDSMHSRMDAWDKEKADAAAKADAEEKEKEKEKSDSRKDGDPDPDAEAKAKEAAADKARKDAEEKEAKEKADAEKEKEMVDSARADADTITEAVLAKVKGMLPQDMSDALYAELGRAQADASELAMAFGDTEPRPLQGESVIAYKRRVLGKYKKHSKTWKDVDLASITDAQVFNIAEAGIRADAMEAAAHPTDIEPGRLRMVAKVDKDTGMRQNVFFGSHTIFKSLGRPSRRVSRIGVPNTGA